MRRAIPRKGQIRASLPLGLWVDHEQVFSYHSVTAGLPTIQKLPRSGHGEGGFHRFARGANPALPRVPTHPDSGAFGSHRKNAGRADTQRPVFTASILYFIQKAGRDKTTLLGSQRHHGIDLRRPSSWQIRRDGRDRGQKECENGKRLNIGLYHLKKGTGECPRQQRCQCQSNRDSDRGHLHRKTNYESKHVDAPCP